MGDTIIIIFGVALLGGYIFLVLRWFSRLPRSWGSRYIQQGNQFLDQGYFEESITVFTRVIEKQPENIDAYLGRSHAYIRVNELDQALSDCESVTLLQPDNHRAFLNRSAIYALKNDYPQSLVEINRCLELQPDSHDGLYNRACYNSKLGKTEHALADFTKVLQITPSDIQTYLERGNLYYETKQFTKAIEDYTRAIKLGYQSWNIYFYRGHSFENIGDSQKSKRDFHHAVQLKPYDDLIQQNPNESTHYFDRGLLYTGAGLYPQAIEDYTRAFELGNQSAELLTHRGYTYLKMKVFEKAQADFEHAIQSDAEARYAMNCLAWLLATCPVTKYRHGKKALNLAQRNCELAGTTDWYDLGTLATAYAEDGQFDEAIKWIKEAITKAPELELHRCKARLTCFEQRKPYTDYGDEE